MINKTETESKLDELNDALTAAEDLFCAQFCQEGSIRFDYGGVQWMFAYTKVDREWGLYVIGKGDQATPIASCGAALRVRVSSLLDELWSACVESEGGMAAQAQMALGSVFKFLGDHGGLKRP